MNDWWPLDWYYVPVYYVSRKAARRKPHMFGNTVHGNHHEAQITLPNGKRFTVQQKAAGMRCTVLAVDAWGRSTPVATPEPLENEFELKAFLIAEAQT